MRAVAAYIGLQRRERVYERVFRGIIRTCRARESACRDSQLFVVAVRGRESDDRGSETVCTLEAVRVILKPHKDL
jgi:hypothetical protein